MSPKIIKKPKTVPLSYWLVGKSTYITGSSKALRPHSDHLLCCSEDVQVFLELTEVQLTNSAKIKDAQ